MSVSSIVLSPCVLLFKFASATVGTVVNAFVFGVCFLQFVEYLSAGYRDNWKLVALLFWVISIDVFQTGATVALMWHYVVANFANPVALLASPWTYASVPIFSTL